MMRALMAAALVLGMGTLPVLAADDKALAALNAALVERDVLPRMDRFAEATAALVPAADAFCATPSAAGLDALKRAYNGAADAWQGIQHFRFGPMELLLRTQRVAFWPDPRNAVGRQLSEVIAARDSAALTPQAFAQGRVTIQGLPAMERLLYDDAAAAKLETGPEAGFRCELLRAIARNLAGIGADMRGEWRDGAKPYARVMTTYGPDAHYRTAQEATLDLFKSLYTAVEIVADHKLGKPLGASLADARPALAESVRSGRSLRNVQLDLEAGAALYRAGMDAYVRDVAKDPTLASAIAQDFDKAIADAKAVSLPVEAAVRDSSRRAAVEKAQRDATALKAVLAQKLSPAARHPGGLQRIGRRLTVPGLSRRAFLAAGAALWSCRSLPAVAGPARVFYGARLEGKDGFFASAFDERGAGLFDLPLPARGHGIALDPAQGRVAFFARRPGDFAVIVDPAARAPVVTLTPSDGSFFCGHGVFSADGALLFATETVAESGDGMIGVYEARGRYARLGGMPSGGMDPHDIRLVRGGRFLAVANGGLLTHPDAPGVKLNLDSMDSSLAFLDLGAREPAASFRLASDLRQLSLRHLAVSGDGTVAVAMQYEGPRGDPVPLVALQRGDGPLTCLDLADADRAALRQYCGSASFDSSGKVLGFTSPVGGAALFVDAVSGRVAGRMKGTDICGIAAEGGVGRFVVTSGLGGAWRVDSSGDSPLGDVATNRRWDNHLASA